MKSSTFNAFTPRHCETAFWAADGECGKLYLAKEETGKSYGEEVCHEKESIRGWRCPRSI